MRSAGSTSAISSQHEREHDLASIPPRRRHDERHGRADPPCRRDVVADTKRPPHAGTTRPSPLGRPRPPTLLVLRAVGWPEHLLNPVPPGRGSACRAAAAHLLERRAAGVRRAGCSARGDPAAGGLRARSILHAVGSGVWACAPCPTHEPRQHVHVCGHRRVHCADGRAWRRGRRRPGTRVLAARARKVGGRWGRGRQEHRRRGDDPDGYVGLRDHAGDRDHRDAHGPPR